MARILNTDEVVDYEEFLNYLNAINLNNVSFEGDSGLLQEDIVTSLLAAGIDPDNWFHQIFNQSLLNQTSDYNQTENHSGIGSIWEEGIMVQLPLYTIIFLLGIAGNGLVILTILQNSRMKTVTNLFLLSLAISDLLLGVFCIPFTLVGAILHDFVFGAVFCKLIPYLQAVSVSVSGWILVAISIERFYAIRHPYTSRRWQTRSHARRIILSVWFGSLALMSPVAILSELKPAGRNGRRKCREVWPNELYEEIFAVFLDFFLLIIPLLLMTFMYALIVNHLWKKDGDRGAEQMEATKCSQQMQPAIATLNNSMAPDENPSPNIRLTVTQNRRSATPSPAVSEANLRRCNPEQGLRTKRHVLKMLIVVVLEFFICWTPLYVVNTLSFFAPKALYEGLGYTGISLVQLLAQASCCCNPITYCFMSSSFRKAFFQAFKRSKGVNHQASAHLATRSLDPRQPSIHHPHQLDSLL